MSDESKQKVKDIFAEFDRTRKTYDTLSALQTLAQYWIENEIIIERAAKAEVEANLPKWTPNWDDEAEVSEWHWERDTAREMHDRTMIPMHRYSCIVMLYTTIERELKRLVENLENEKGKQKLKWSDVRSSSTLEQISKFCDAFFNLQLANCVQNDALNDLRKIRNCIVHNQGDLSQAKKNEIEFLVNLRQKRQGFFAHPNNDIIIDEPCIKQFMVEIRAFFVSVFCALGWEIASHWQGDKLEKEFARLKP